VAAEQESFVSPMFPLSAVVFPSTALPMRIFEPRYQQLMADLLAGDGELEFAISPIVRGREVGGGDERLEVATMCKLAQVMVQPTGEYTFLALGQRRVRVVEWLQDDPYPRAEVVEMPDGDELPPASAVAREINRVEKVLIQLGAEVPDHLPLVDGDERLAAFRLAGMVPIADLDRQAILCSDSPAERLGRFSQALGDLEAVLKFRGG
jgi:Lon protease-like protein